MGNPGAGTSATRSDRPVLRLNKSDLPLMVEYDDKTYVLVLTKGEKLLLQKPQLPCGISWQGADQTI
jgi:hypothetical protein